MDYQKNHENLKSNVPFEQLPQWFKEAETKDAYFLHYPSTGKSSWISGIWKRGIWENGKWENGTWENGKRVYGEGVLG